ncbi:hypothetical protein HX049_08400 [Myroides odoratimimus]|uniref:hypothetical protein n=1 Tax=Myroides odoratimimus TaxID=76832 RepID=UPI002575F4F1|nr:hypothetical protein [Myroides odoratimimus]MDM1397193.1 hypothetical protein [Myroides odoratimimus]
MFEKDVKNCIESIKVDVTIHNTMDFFVKEILERGKELNVKAISLSEKINESISDFLSKIVSNERLYLLYLFRIIGKKRQKKIACQLGVDVSSHYSVWLDSTLLQINVLDFERVSYFIKSLFRTLLLDKLSEVMFSIKVLWNSYYLIDFSELIVKVIKIYTYYSFIDEENNNNSSVVRTSY